MRSHLFYLVGAASLSAASSAHAESVATAPYEPQPDAVVRAVVFAPARASGPRRSVDDAPRKVEPDARSEAVLDWVSPVFVWIEQGYAYAEVTLHL